MEDFEGKGEVQRRVIEPEVLPPAEERAEQLARRLQIAREIVPQLESLLEDMLRGARTTNVQSTSLDRYMQMLRDTLDPQKPMSGSEQTE